MAVVDEEKQAAIYELKTKYDTNNAKLKQLESQKRQNEVNLRRAAFTASHLDELPDNVATYRSIGKAYFFEPKAAMMSHLQEVVEKADKELKAAVASKEGLVASQEAVAKELNEFLGTGKKK